MQHETKFLKVEYFSLIHKQACVRLPTTTVNLILLAFATERHVGAPLLLSADRAAHTHSRLTALCPGLPG